MGHRPGIKGGYFPVPPVDSAQDMRGEYLKALKTWVLRLKTSPRSSSEPTRIRDVLWDTNKYG